MNDHKADVETYIGGVLSGATIAGRLVRLAVERHVCDLKHAGSRGYVFDEDKAWVGCELIERLCKHSKGEWAGEAFKLSPWQKFIVWAGLGWRERETGYRRFRKWLIEIARKNGKTTFASALLFVLQVADDEHGADLFCVATKEEQARLVFNEYKRMVDQSDLAPLCERLVKSVTYQGLNSIVKPLGSDSDTTDGLNPHVVVKDELHAWRERHRGLHEKLSTGGASRRQPLEITITTAGDDDALIWQEERAYAVRILEHFENPINDKLFAFIACLDADDDIYDEKNWPKANPNIGVSVKLEYLRDQATEAQQKPTAESAFRRYHCNLKTSSNQKAIKPELWKAGTAKIQWAGRQGHGGFDLGRTSDFAAIGAVLPRDDGGYDLRALSFTCEDRPDQLQTPEVQGWIDAGFLIEHPGNEVDFRDVERHIVAWSDEMQIRTWGFDPTFAAVTGQNLINDYGFEAVKITQSARTYNEPIRLLQKLLALEMIGHEADDCLAWQMENLQIKRNAQDEWTPDKSATQVHGHGRPDKIDACVALLMALFETLFAEKEAPLPQIG